jgi:hypothetical protein
VKKLYVLILSFTLINTYLLNAREAVIIASVIDCLGEPIEDINKKRPAITYENIEICGDGSQPYGCPRVHQLLFNQRINVIEEKYHEAKIEIPDIFYQLKGSPERYATFWIKKKSFVYLDDLKKRAIDTSIIPPAHTINDQVIPQKTILTLIEPHSDQKSGIHFCVGTRFIETKIPSDQKGFKSVSMLNPKTSSVHTLLIPAHKLLSVAGKTTEEKIAVFVTLLKKWAHQKQGFIPYVWGGCSIRKYCTMNFFYKKSARNGFEWYKRFDTGYPHTGVDCAGMILLAAQIAELPFYLKNSTTIKQNLKPVKNYHDMRIGDIIWIPGHVMVIVDVKNAQIVEARHYTHGYGKVHQMPLKRIFKNIYSFKDLMHSLEKDEPLNRLDSKGLSVQKINECVVLSLRSGL